MNGQRKYVFVNFGTGLIYEDRDDSMIGTWGLVEEQIQDFILLLDANGTS